MRLKQGKQLPVADLASMGVWLGVEVGIKSAKSIEKLSTTEQIIEEEKATSVPSTVAPAAPLETRRLRDRQQQ